MNSKVTGKALYVYKDTVQIPPLGMIDDIVAATECDSETCESVKTNSVINKFIESKKLQFGPEKCHQMHVGSDSSIKNCKTLKVHNETMTKVDQEKYVGDIISSNMKYSTNIEARRNRGYGIITEILSILREVPLGKYRIEIGLKLRE